MLMSFPISFYGFFFFLHLVCSPEDLGKDVHSYICTVFIYVLCIISL